MIKKIVELYSYRELLLNLVVKELKVKYKDSVLGFFWSLLNPALLIVIYTFVFSIVFTNKGIDNFSLFLMAGLLPWLSFSNTLNMSANAIVGNSALIRKIYFPRELFPLAIVLANAFSLLFELGLLMILLAVFGYSFYAYLPIVLLALILQLMLTIGFGLMVSAVTVRFRDLKQLINIVLRAGFFVTPIIYPLSRLENIPELYQSLLRLNPMASIVMLYKLALYYNKVPGTIIFAGAVLGSVSIFIAGFAIFSRLAPNFAKEI